MKNLIALLVLFLLLSFTLYSQQHDIKAETDSNIPALENFHEVIYPIWHTAYPAKDIAMLKKLLPDVNIKASEIYDASLPGILRDRKEKWDKAIAIFKESVDEYNKQANGTNDEALLNAAEKMHANYEMLVRTIRPVTKEIDEFHKLLYVIYHNYLPSKNFEKINSLTGDLLIKSEAIVKVDVPKRVAAKKDLIKNAAEDLLASVKELKEKGAVIDVDEYPLLVEKMHSKYQKLEELF